MKILVLGSEGFIGSHAVLAFEKAGHHVTKADIVLKQEKNYHLINPELPDFSAIFRSREFDVCLNATGAANVQLSFAYPGLDYILNTANVYHILDNIRQYNAGCRFINLSSAAVYGNPVSLPVTEAHAVNPLSPYGFHKWHSEQICKQFHVLYNLQTVSLRIFSAYGTGLKKQLFWDLYKKISSAAGPVEMFGTGKESRDFIYIDDIIEALNCILTSHFFNGDIINIASGTESTIEEAVNIFREAFNKAVTIKYKGENKEGDPLNWRADITKLKSIGFEPRIPLHTGIRQYTRWVGNAKI